jgi:hypothetical protein
MRADWNEAPIRCSMKIVALSGRNWALALLLILGLTIASPQGLRAWAGNAALRPTTVAQLEQYVAAAGSERDAETAHEIEAMELTERLSAVRLERCQAVLRGPHARMALLTLADRSAFLDPPANEIPAKEAPDLAAQKEMIALTVEYVKNTLHRLPNLSATRVTTTFQRASRSQNSLRLAGRTSALVSYRDGKEMAAFRGAYSRTLGLTTDGEFGPILDTVLRDSIHGHVQWSHWEEGAAGSEAVFRYVVSQGESHYKVDGLPFAYQGEFAIDPSDGAILRIALRTDFVPANPLEMSVPESRTADIAVEYGPVELGGKTYICPLRGIAVSNAVNPLLPSDPALMWLNDRVFESYHLLRSDMRMMPGFSQIQ